MDEKVFELPQILKEGFAHLPQPGLSWQVLRASNAMPDMIIILATEHGHEVFKRMYDGNHNSAQEMLEDFCKQFLEVLADPAGWYQPRPWYRPAGLDKGAP